MRKCATMGLLSMAGKPRIGEVTRCEPTSAPSQQSGRNRGKTHLRPLGWSATAPQAWSLGGWTCGAPAAPPARSATAEEWQDRRGWQQRGKVDRTGAAPAAPAVCLGTAPAEDTAQEGRQQGTPRSKPAAATSLQNTIQPNPRTLTSQLTNARSSISGCHWLMSMLKSLMPGAAAGVSRASSTTAAVGTTARHAHASCQQPAAPLQGAQRPRLGASRTSTATAAHRRTQLPPLIHHIPMPACPPVFSSLSGTKPRAKTLREPEL